VRAQAFQRRATALGRDEDLHAFALLKLAGALNHVASLHNFDDAVEQAYFDRFLNVAEVTRLLERVRASSGLNEEYERLGAEQAARVLHLPEVKVWDLPAAASSEAPHFTFAEARQAILRAAAPLGSEYVAELEALLDPRNGRLDLGPGPRRKRTGFSRGFSGQVSVVYVGEFGGTYSDVRVLAHESAHAVHRALMDRAGVSPDSSEGPHFLFESFAILNELLLAEDLAQHEDDPARRQYFLERFLDGKGLVAFVAAPEAEFEERVYRGVKEGRLTSAAQLGDLSMEVFGRYSVWPARTSEMRYRWMEIPLLFEDPFYDVNYVYGGVLGLVYLQALRSQPDSFVRDYVALLKNGFDAPPDALLKRFLHLDLGSEDLTRGAFGLLRARIQELRESYAHSTIR